MLSVKDKEKELLLALRLDKRQGCEMLYRQYAALIYGFITYTVTDAAAATDILLCTFKEAYGHIDELQQGHRSVFIWLLNIARNILNGDIHCHIPDGQVHALILFKGMSYEQVANSANTLPGVIKTDLRAAIKKMRQP